MNKDIEKQIIDLFEKLYDTRYIADTLHYSISYVYQVIRLHYAPKSVKQALEEVKIKLYNQYKHKEW